jgi:hypothetical protein
MIEMIQMIECLRLNSVPFLKFVMLKSFPDMPGVLIRRRDYDTDTQREDHVGTQGKIAIRG